MQLETAQMLSSAADPFLSSLGLDIDEKERVMKKLDFKYKDTHTNHPCTKWVSESVKNIFWFGAYAYYMDEHWYTYRGDSHKSAGISLYIAAELIGAYCTSNLKYIKHSNYQAFIDALHKHSTHIDVQRMLDRWCGSPPPKCVTHDTSKQIEDTIHAYRHFYAHYKKYDKNGKLIMKYDCAVANIKASPENHTIYKIDSGNTITTYSNKYNDGDLNAINGRNIVPLFVFDEWIQNQHKAPVSVRKYIQTLTLLFNDPLKCNQNSWIHRDIPFLPEKDPNHNDD